MMKTLLTVVMIFVGLVQGVNAEVKEGDTVQLLANLHPDINRRLAYSLNYQLPSLIPVCSEVKVEKLGRKKMVFNWKGVEYTFKYDGHTKKAGIPFEQSVNTYFGAKCDKTKMARLSKLDKEGIRLGRAKVGMSREGILFAMGRPPYHANPDLDAPSWLYWMNRYNKTAIEFDEKGKVSAVRG